MNTIHVLVFLTSLLLCWLYRPLALRWRIVDVPTQRSAHDSVIPRGGGVALLLAFGLGCAGMHLLHWYDLGNFTGILLLMVVLVISGLFDDRSGLRVWFRLLLYAGVCIAAATHLLGVEMFWLLALPAAFYLLWLLNMFNFMDGIDGLAGSETVFVTMAVALLGIAAGADPLLIQLNFLLASASVGFLVLNWPGASLFLGDTGSIPLGFLLGALSLSYALDNIVWIYIWLILLAGFLADTTLTLVWRIVSGQNFLESHNLHAYQRLSRHWNSHGRVLLLVHATNLLWLLPIACMALWFPDFAVYLLVLAYLPLLAGVWKTYNLP